MAQPERPACMQCLAPMDIVEEVAVLQSLAGHAVFACDWCGQITLVCEHARVRTASWVGSVPPELRVFLAAP